MPWITKMLPCVTLMQIWYLWKAQKKLLISHPDSTSQQLLLKLQIIQHISLKWQLCMAKQHSHHVLDITLGAHRCLSKCPCVYTHKARYTWKIVRWEFTVHQELYYWLWFSLRSAWHPFFDPGSLSCKAEYATYFLLLSLYGTRKTNWFISTPQGMKHTKGVDISGTALAFSNRERRAGVHSKVRQHDKEDQQMFSIATTAFSMPATSSIIAKVLPPKVVAFTKPRRPNRCAVY